MDGSEIQYVDGSVRIKQLIQQPPRLFSLRASPIEMAFAKIKTLIRKAATRTYEKLWQAVGNVCNLFRDEECYNFFKAAGYEIN